MTCVHQRANTTSCHSPRGARTFCEHQRTGPMYLPFAEFASLAEGFAAADATPGAAFPFVVRGGVDEWPSVDVIRSDVRREASVKGYVGAAGRVAQTLAGARLLEAWDDESLLMNVVDAASTRSCTSLLCTTLRDRNARSDTVSSAMWLAYVVSPTSPPNDDRRDGGDVVVIGDAEDNDDDDDERRIESSLHVDPPHGSNWQYLACGTKVWFCLDAAAFSLVDYEQRASDDDGQGRRRRRRMPSLDELAREFGCYKTSISAGDFVSVPINWPHAVRTTVKSIGISGYTESPPAAAAKKARVASSAIIPGGTTDY